MSKHLKKYSSDFKLKVVLKYLSEETTVSQICQDFNVSKATVHKWVNQFKGNSSLIFNESSLTKDTERKKKLAEKEVANLYAKIGELTVERDFLKKVLDA
jgi:transposase-like protein